MVFPRHQGQTQDPDFVQESPGEPRKWAMTRLDHPPRVASRALVHQIGREFALIIIAWYAGCVHKGVA